MTYESLNNNLRDDLTGLPNRHMNFLILNSLSFFERSLLLMEKHKNIHLFLDHDNSGRKYTNLALKGSLQFKDESKLYAGYKDLNDWMMNFGKLDKKIYAGQKSFKIIAVTHAQKIARVANPLIYPIFFCLIYLFDD